MADLLKAAIEGDERELYQGVLENLVETLENGCEPYVKPNLVKQIIAVRELLAELEPPQDDGDELDELRGIYGKVG